MTSGVKNLTRASAASALALYDSICGRRTGGVAGNTFGGRPRRGGEAVLMVVAALLGSLGRETAHYETKSHFFGTKVNFSSKVYKI